MILRTTVLAAFASFSIIASGDTEPGNRTTPDEIAGRTMAQWSEQLTNDNRTIRLRALRSVSAFGEPAADALIRSLDHDDAAMRYVAAVAIGDLGKETAESAKKALSKLAESDPSAAVVDAASYALCRAGMVSTALPRLLDRLTYPERGTVCSVCELIGKVGPPATSAMGPLRELVRENQPGGDGDYHIGGAAKNALRNIGGDSQ